MSQFNCPHCGRPIQAVAIKQNNWSIEPTIFDSYADQARRYGDVASSPTTTVASEPPVYAERRIPSRVPGKEPDVWVPFLKSLITGGLIGLPAGVALTVSGEWPWWSPLGITSGVVGASWLLFLAHSQGTLWVKEIIDNRKSAPAPVRPEPSTLQVEITYLDEKGKRRRMQYVDVFPADVLQGTSPEGIMQFVGAAIEGDSLSEGDWTGSARPFGQRKFRRLMGVLEASGLIERVGYGRNATRQLSLSGRAVFRKILERGL